MLVALAKRPAETVGKHLLVATQIGMLMALDKGKFRFMHDRTQQAAYYLIPENKRNSMHLGIGQTLLKNTPKDHLEKNVLEITNHLNHGAALILQVLASQAAISLQNAALY